MADEKIATWVALKRSIPGIMKAKTLSVCPARHRRAQSMWSYSALILLVAHILVLGLPASMASTTPATSMREGLPDQLTQALVPALSTSSRRRLAQHSCGDKGQASCYVAYLKRTLASLRQNHLKFWTTFGRDKTYGGMLGTLGRKGEVIPPSDKGLIQQARHLWTFSTYYQQYGGTNPEVKAIADSAYKFLMTKFLDKKDNLFVNAVTNKGVVKTAKSFNLYSNAFAIYGLAKYAETFKVKAAANQALATFKALEARCYDPVNKGYLQTRDSPIREKDSKGAPVPKGQNSLLHLMEAYTQLYKTTKDNQVKTKLLELMQVIVDKIFFPASTNPRAGLRHYYLLEYFTSTWQPIPGKGQTQVTTTHGHAVEFCYLLLEAVDILGSAMPAKQAQRVKEVALGAADYAVYWGLDKPKLKSLCPESAVGAPCSDPQRYWWGQAEAMQGMWKLYEHTGDVSYLRRIADMLSYVVSNHVDSFGEQFAIVDTSVKSSALADRLISYQKMPKDFKGGGTKASYHSMRAIMNLEAWIK